jgi:transcriptional regulator with XRE-family HTH domain
MKKNQKIEITVEDVASVLHDLRKKKMMTQQAVAEKLGMSQSNFSKMENAVLEPSVIQWITFCQLMGVKSDLIIQEKNAKKMIAPEAETEQNERDVAG